MKLDWADKSWLQPAREGGWRLVLLLAAEVAWVVMVLAALA